MMMYSINFVLCSGLLLIVYRLFLQNERMYRFNRFYLLFSLVFSVAVPFITFTTHTQIVPVNYQQAVGEVFAPQSINLPARPAQALNKPVSAAAEPRFSPAVIGMAIAFGVYVLIAIVLLSRFVFNLYRISRSVSQNEMVAVNNTQIILTNDDITPHSFLKYVFINRYDYCDGAIAPEIILHEQTHVKQLHSLDVLLVELFQAICWFNPFIPFYRKAIQLNHEFLADEAVIDNCENTPAYQYLLLAKASQAHSFKLTSQFNYLSTKKRLIMMTKTTSAKIAIGKKIALAPVLAAALFLFSNKISAQQKSKVAEIRIDEPVKEIRIDEPLPKKKPGKGLAEVRIDKPLAKVKLGKQVAEVRIDEPLAEVRIEEPLAEVRIEEPLANVGLGKKVAEVRIDEPVAADEPITVKYKATLKKYDFPPDPSTLKLYKPTGKKIISAPDFSAEDKAKLIELFSQMNRQQREEQWVWFLKGPPPMRKQTPTDDLYQSFKDPKKYGVWIDGIKVGSEKLAGYKPADFDHYFISKLYGGAAKGKTYSHQLDLMTKTYYAEYLEKAKVNNKIYHTLVHIPAKYTKGGKSDAILIPDSAMPPKVGGK